MSEVVHAASMKRLCIRMLRRRMKTYAMSSSTPLVPLSVALMAGRICKLILAQQFVDRAGHMLHRVIIRGAVVLADHALLVGDGELHAVQHGLVRLSRGIAGGELESLHR